jgi:two-component system, cell cycle sensor histidine kinase and response regulator CckA
VLSLSPEPSSPPPAAAPAAEGHPLRWAGWIIIAIAAAGLGLELFGPRFGMKLNDSLMMSLLGSLAICAAVILVMLDRMQGQIEQEKLLFAETADSESTGMAICGSDGKALYSNAAFWRQLEPYPMMGVDHSNPELALASYFGNDQKRAEDFARIRKAAHDGQAGTCELLLKDAADVTHCFLVSAWPSKASKSYVTWRLEDISPRVQVQEVIAREQARWVDFMDHAPVGFFSADASGKLVFANATLARWLGTTARELTAQTHLHDILSKPSGDSALYDLTVEGGDFQQGEFTLKGPGGRQLQALIAQTLDRSKDGVIRTRAVVHDLTAERKWQQALQDSQTRFRRFFEESPIGVALVAEGGMLAECNPAFLRMIGADAPQILAQPLTNFVDSGPVNLAGHLARVSETSELLAPLEVKLKASGGREITVQLYARRLEEGDVTGAKHILHFIDMSEQKNLEARFAQSQKMQAIGQLAGGVAHDFNNLLTAMIGFCDLLLLRHRPGDPSFADIMQIKQNANRAAGLVRQLLAFSRQQTLQPKVLNISDVLVDLSHLLRRLIGENIQLEMVHGRELGMVKADQGQIEQVIINMAVNARDAMPSGGKVTVTTSNLALRAPLRREHEEVPVGEWVVIEIADNGTGIPADIVGRIFDPFFSTKEVGKGTGLGLSTCYGIVKQTGGYIFVDSEVGRGTTFSVYLPRHTRTAAEQAEVQKAEAAEKVAPDLTGAGVIMLIEDEDAVRMFAARALKNKGYTVVEARSGDHALEVLKGHTGKIDLIISDVMMPGIDGPTAMRAIKKERPEVKAIFISGYSEDKLRESFESGEEVHFLPKPFSLKQLAEKVKDVLKA